MLCASVGASAVLGELGFVQLGASLLDGTNMQVSTGSRSVRRWCLVGWGGLGRC